MHYWQPSQHKPLSIALRAFIALFFGILLATSSWASEQSNSFVSQKAYWVGNNPQTAKDVHWQSYNGMLTQGYGNQPVWIRLSVTPIAGLNPEQPIEIDIRPGYLDQIDLFDPSNSHTTHKTVGDHFNWSNSIRPSLSYNFSVPNGSKPRTLLLRIKTDSTRLVEVTALAPSEVASWDRQMLTESSFILFGLLLFFLWAAYNWFINKDAIFGAFTLLQGVSVTFGFFVLGFGRIYLSNIANPPALDLCTRASIISITYCSLWFYKTWISPYQIKRWALYATNALISSIVIVITLYVAGLQWLSHQINSTIAILGCITFLLISIWGIPWKQLPPSPKLLPKRIVVGYFSTLVIINLIHSAAILNLGMSSLLVGYGSTINGLLSGLLLTIILQYRSKSIQTFNQQQLIAQKLATENERHERERQSNFLDMLAHELKTPLSVVSLALDANAPSEKLNLLASNAVSNMKEVITRCHQESKIANNAIHLSLELTDLNALIRRAIDQRIEAPQIEYKLDDIATINCDPEFLGIAVNNLLDNAIKYGKKGSKVKIELREDQTTQMLHIAFKNDIGPAGTPNVKKLFEKYYRSPNAHNETGSGLGLYISRRLVQMHSGDISYETHDGQIVFRINLPTDRSIKQL